MPTAVPSSFILHPSLRTRSSDGSERRSATPEGARSSRAGFAYFPGSSKGRTPVFGTGCGGSSPPPGVRFRRQKLWLGWRNWKTRGVESAVGNARWGFDSPLQHRVREWCNRQTHRPQKAALVSSNLTSRTKFKGVRARGPNGRGGSLKKSPGAGSTPAAHIPRARSPRRQRRQS